MRTYFIRHTKDLDIDEDTLRYLWDNDFIAIHFPWSKSNPRPSELDSESLNENDYEGSAKQGIKTFNTIAEEGGYICAQYRNQNNYKIGYVSRGYKIAIFPGKWGSKNKVAKLKVMKISNVKEVGPLKSVLINNVRPRQGTVRCWMACGDIIQKMVDGQKIDSGLDILSSDDQEVICQEYLRNKIDPDLPILQSLLCSTGRTMKDIDILGLSNDNKFIIAQVTNSPSNSQKVESLKKYSGKNTHLIMFCPGKLESREDILYYPIDKVINSFSNTELGKNYLYAKKKLYEDNNECSPTNA
jgi:hypothetical protein